VQAHSKNLDLSKNLGKCQKFGQKSFDTFKVLNGNTAYFFIIEGINKGLLSNRKHITCV